jgi:hypothetical protein
MICRASYASNYICFANLIYYLYLAIPAARL